MKRLACLLFLITLSFSANAAFLHAGKPLKNRYIVTLAVGTRADEVDALSRSLAHQHGGRLLATMKYAMRGFGVEMNEMQARALSQNPLVALVEEDEEVQISDEPQPDVFAPRRLVQATAATAQRTNAFLQPRPLSNNCPWNGGGYFVCTYQDDSFWHLDRLDNQGSLYGYHAYAYNTTGQGVRAYVIDSGVYGTHSEFYNASTGENRVEVGANMMVDPAISDQPLPGEEPPVAQDGNPPNNPCGGWLTDPNAIAGHGTGVASVLGGTTVGVAKNVTIVPVKVINCYGQRAKLSVARGLDWVISDMSVRPGRAVVSMSTFVDTLYEGNHLCEDGHGGLTNCVAAIENEVNNVIGANIPVVVSANNRDDGECRTSPADMGYGNEANHPSYHRTITVGGTMAVAPGYADARWTCAASPDGCDAHWVDATFGYGRGSNFGPCVSIWAPAWNMKVAGAAGPTSYRTRYDPTADPNNPGTAGPSSGTSWSAPYTAGVIARLLERYPSLTPDGVWQALTSRADQHYCCLPSFDPSRFNNRLVYMSPFE